jgi:hypothetical protein
MISALELNLASRPFRNNLPLWIGYGMGAVLTLGFTAWNIWAAVDQAQRTETLRSSLATVESRLGDLDRRNREAAAAIDAIDVKSLKVRARKANDVIDRRALSWTRLFNRLEEVQPYEVRMVSIRPVYAGAGRRQTGLEEVPDGTVPVKVEGAAQSLEAFLEFERALILDTHFAQVEPERTQIVSPNEVLFTVNFLYDPEGRLGDEGSVKLPPVLPAVAELEAEQAAEEAAKAPKPEGDDAP